MSPIPNITPKMGGPRLWVTNGIASTTLEYLQRIVKDSSYAHIDGFLTDTFTASAILCVHKALKPQGQAKLLSLSIPRMAQVSFKVLK